MEYGCLPIANVEEVFLLHFLVKVIPIPYTVEMDGCFFFFLHMGNNECIFQNARDPKMIDWVSQALRVQNTLGGGVGLSPPKT